MSFSTPPPRGPGVWPVLLAVAFGALIQHAVDVRAGRIDQQVRDIYFLAGTMVADRRGPPAP